MNKKSSFVSNSSTKVDAEYLSRQKESMKRRHRVSILLNDKEKAAVDEYCRLFTVSSKSGLFRQATMERILAILDENHPTLF